MTIPETISRYQIRREVGRGGMAVLYLAFDPNFNREVAIKVLSRQLTIDPQFLGRFRREAQAIASLEHPAIVPVYDYGEENDSPYLVMRFMSGGTLQQKIRQSGRLPVGEAVRIFNQITPALDRAHRQGIIHRDLKPANILFDEDGNAYVSDFGIAKLTESTANFTGSAIIGTPAYMSPEQIKGERTIDGRTDVYSLGIMLYEMLTGEIPYKAETPTKQLMKHVLEPVPRLSAALPTAPTAVEAVLTQALAKEPEQRFPSAGQFSRALQSAAAQPAGGGFATIIDDIEDATIFDAPPPSQPPAPPYAAAAPAGAPRREAQAAAPSAAPAAARKSGGVLSIPLLLGIGSVVAVIALAAFFFMGGFGDGDGGDPPEEGNPAVVQITSTEPASPTPAVSAIGQAGASTQAGTTEPAVIATETPPPPPTETLPPPPTETLPPPPTETPPPPPTNTPPPPPTNTPRPLPTVTSPPPSTATPEGNSVRITNIGLNGNSYVVDFVTTGFTPVLPGLHIHFYFNTISESQAGLPGGGPWQIYPASNGGSGTSPFTLLGQNQAGGATQMCAVVANLDHSIQPGTGNCWNLP